MGSNPIASILTVNIFPSSESVAVPLAPELFSEFKVAVYCFLRFKDLCAILVSVIDCSSWLSEDLVHCVNAIKTNDPNKKLKNFPDVKCFM